MRRMIFGLLAAGLMAGAAVGQDQSLGDLARANREKLQEQQAAGITPKVITNKDLPANATAGIPEENPAEPMTQVSGVQRPIQRNPDGARPFRRPGDGEGMEGARGENLKEKIEAQENRIAEMQARLDRLNAMMNPNGSTVQYEGPGSRYQAMQAQRIEMMQQMLDQQKQRLAAMQDAARHEGAHTAVYDPSR